MEKFKRSVKKAMVVKEKHPAPHAKPKAKEPVVVKKTRTRPVKATDQPPPLPLPPPTDPVPPIPPIPESLPQPVPPPVEPIVMPEPIVVEPVKATNEPRRPPFQSAVEYDFTKVNDKILEIVKANGGTALGSGGLKNILEFQDKKGWTKAVEALKKFGQERDLEFKFTEYG